MDKFGLPDAMIAAAAAVGRVGAFGPRGAVRPGRAWSGLMTSGPVRYDELR